MSSSRGSDVCHNDLDISSDEISESGDLGLGQQCGHSYLGDLESVTECNVLPTIFSATADNCSEGTSGYSSVSRSSSVQGRVKRSDLKELNSNQLSKGLVKRLSNFALNSLEKDDEEESCCSLTSYRKHRDIQEEEGSSTNDAISKTRSKNKKHRRKVKNVENIDSISNNDEHPTYYEQMETLRNEIDVHKSLLASKCEAIKLLKALLSQVTKKKEETEYETKEKNHELTSHVSHLEFQIDCQLSDFQRGQQNWLEKYNSISETNRSLEEELSKKDNEMKKLNHENAVLRREKDELMALLDTKERRRYERSNSFTSDDCYGSISSGELAVLGACVCRGDNMEPCKCAVATCAKQKEIQHLHKGLDKKCNKIKELRNSIDVYKKAFYEEQKKCSYLVKRNACLEVFVEKSHIAKSKNVNEIGAIDTLTEMLCEKNEALVHQQLVTKFLAKRVTQLELSLEKERQLDMQP